MLSVNWLLLRNQFVLSLHNLQDSCQCISCQPLSINKTNLALTLTSVEVVTQLSLAEVNSGMHLVSKKGNHICR